MKIPTIKTSKIDIKNYWQNIKTYSVAYLSKINKNDKLYITTDDVFLKNSYRKLILHTIDKQGYGSVYRNTFKNTESFTNRNYEKLSPLQIQAIRSNIPIDMAANAEIIVDTARLIKKIFDKKYGEGNYVYVSIGTSAAGIGRVMEFSGVETKYLPVSDLREILTDKHESKIGKKFAAYSNFLETQGLSPETIQKSPKQYLFFDYTAEGTSLRNFEHLLNKFCSIKGDNVHFYSLNETLEKFEQELTGKIKGTAAYVDKYLNKPSIAFYSGIPHLNIDKINKVKKAEKFESLEAKKYNFCVIDLLYKKGMLQKNSKNNKAL